MAVIRVERTRDFTVMSNHHLKNPDLTLKAKGLMSFVLSLPDEWQYSTRGLAAVCKEGVGAIGKALKELETAGYIVRNQLRGSDGRITDTEYIIYEQPQFPPYTASPDIEKPYMDTPYVGFPDTDLAPQINTKVNKKKEEENTYQSSTHSFFPSKKHTADGTTDGMADVSEIRNEIMDRIDYDHISAIANRIQIDEFVELMLEVALTRSPSIKIGRDVYPTGFVQERFSKLSSEHIQKVLDGISENTTRVWNTKAYLLVALFNAPVSIDNHYTMLVNHDLYSGE